MPELQIIDKNRITEEGEKIYQKIKDKLKSEYRGKIIAIDIDTGDYFLGDSVTDATNKARKKHPNKIFYAARVGYPVAFIRR